MEQEIMQAVGQVVAIGTGLAPLVYAAVTQLRGALGNHKRRRVIMPVSGLVLGWLFAGLTLALIEADPTLKNAAIGLLSGYWAYEASALLHAHGKEART